MAGVGDLFAFAQEGVRFAPTHAGLAAMFVAAAMRGAGVRRWPSPGTRASRGAAMARR